MNEQALLKSISAKLDYIIGLLEQERKETPRVKVCIRTYRKERGWTQQELANKAGLGKNTIYSYEKGVRNPTLCGLDKVAKALGCSVQDLLEERESAR